MSELRFVGVGLGDERSLSMRAIDALRACDEVFAEEYTAELAAGSLERLAGWIGREVIRLPRTEVEDAARIMAALDRHARVGFVVPGDPFAATTHVALRLAAEARGHCWSYFPNASILTAAAGFLGLQPYRFGRIVSVPFPEPGFAPVSPLEMIAANRAVRLHSLVLLDLRPSERRFLGAGDALTILRERDPTHRWLPSGVPTAVVARVGSDAAEAWVGPLEELAVLDFGPPMHAIVLPAADLHFEEEAALARWAWPRPGRLPR